MDGRMRIRSRGVLLEGAPAWTEAAVQVGILYLPGFPVEVRVSSPHRTRRRGSFPISRPQAIQKLVSASASAGAISLFWYLFW